MLTNANSISLIQVLSSWVQSQC